MQNIGSCQLRCGRAAPLALNLETLMLEFDEIADQLDTEHYTAQKGLQTWRGVELEPLCRLVKTDTDTVLRAMCEVANRYPLKPGEKRCRSCGMPMRFRGGVPYDREGLNHFISCPNRKAHRRKD